MGVMFLAVVTLEDFAKKIRDLLKSDRDVSVGVGGFTGEGKSTFSSKLAKQYSKVAGVYWGFDRMTWSRKEMMLWIDGDKDGNGQLPEYSVILPDELFRMFYRRLWYEDDQIDAIATLNMCRDRHLLIIGNIPNFWELDPGFTNRIRFYVYIPYRGVAWVFEQELNPFTSDYWNKQECKKVFRKHKAPSRLPNYLFTIHYDDWDADEKRDYYRIRNQKRLTANLDNKSEKKERYGSIKAQRDNLIRMIPNLSARCKKCKKDHPVKLTNKDISDVVGMSEEAVRLIRTGAR